MPDFGNATTLVEQYHLKLNIVAQKISGKPRKSWNEVLLGDKKKLEMDTADPQNRSE